MFGKQIFRRWRKAWNCYFPLTSSQSSAWIPLKKMELNASLCKLLPLLLLLFVSQLILRSCATCKKKLWSYAIFLKNVELNSNFCLHFVTPSVLLQRCGLRWKADLSNQANWLCLGHWEGWGEKEAEEELKGGLNTMAMARHGGEFAVRSSGALCHHRYHQHCEYCMFLP